MPSLPHDLIVDILTRLPVKTLLQFRCVCKPWCELMKNHYFVKMHLKRAKENDDLKLMVVDSDGLYSMDFNGVLPAEVVNMDHPFNSSKNFALSFDYCNGLFCITIWVDCRNEFFTYLWNPSTKEYKELPAIPYDMPDGSVFHHSEDYIGYDYNIEDYTVVRIVGYNQNQTDFKLGYEVNVYTLGSNSWRSIKKIPCSSVHVMVGSRILVNGALHWVVVRFIVSLDIGDEKYRLVPLPKSLDEELDQMSLGLLEGCLCILCRYGQQRADVWLMKDYGVIESWTKLCTIGRESLRKLLTTADNLEASVDYTYFRPIDIFKTGEILLHNAGMDNSIPFFLYDPKHERVTGVGDCFYHCHTANSYVGSLAALNLGTYGKQPVDGEAELVTYGKQPVDGEAELNYLFETTLMCTESPEEQEEVRESASGGLES